MLKTLFTHLLFRKDDVLILDMYAGVEHLGRATVDFVDALIIVVEPTRRSIGTAVQIQQLAHDIGLKRIWLVGNKVRDQKDADFLQTNPLKIPILGLLPVDDGVAVADREGTAVYNTVPVLKEAAQQMIQALNAK